MLIALAYVSSTVPQGTQLGKEIKLFQHLDIARLSPLYSNPLHIIPPSYHNLLSRGSDRAASITDLIVVSVSMGVKPAVRSLPKVLWEMKMMDCDQCWQFKATSAGVY
jgi:hypothetical protein